MSPNSPIWFVTRSGPGEPADNMAWDEALLDGMGELGRPVLRFYGWSRPAATFGYFQDYAMAAEWTALRPLLRRPTAGGLVSHDGDWTYSLCFPVSDPWYGLRAVESYQRLHEWIQRALAVLGVATILAPSRVDAGPGQCFVGAEQFDLVLAGSGGLKVAGAAQRRRKDGLLIQGSIQPRVGNWRFGQMALARAMCEMATEQWQIRWQELPALEAMQVRARALVVTKYGREEFHRTRLGLPNLGPASNSSCDPKGAPP